MASILITGGKGFIGRTLVKALEGHQVTVYDVGDEIPMGPFDGVIHLAAVSRVKTGEEDPLACLTTNIHLTGAMLQAAHLWAAWFVLVSTQEQGDNFYGMSKRFAEQYAKRFSEQKGMKLKVIRPPVVWGRGDNPAKLIPRIADGAAVFDLPPVEIVHVEEVVKAILDGMGESGEADLRGDVVRPETLQKFVEYVAHPDT